MILSTCRMSRFFQTCWRDRNSHSLVLEIIGNAEHLGVKLLGRIISFCFLLAANEDIIRAPSEVIGVLAHNIVNSSRIH
jgi:hypothetical protein